MPAPDRLADHHSGSARTRERRSRRASSPTDRSLTDARAATSEPFVKSEGQRRDERSWQLTKRHEIPANRRNSEYGLYGRDGLRAPKANLVDAEWTSGLGERAGLENRYGPFGPSGVRIPPLSAEPGRFPCISWGNGPRPAGVHGVIGGSTRANLGPILRRAVPPPFPPVFGRTDGQAIEGLSRPARGQEHPRRGHSRKLRSAGSTVAPSAARESGRDDEVVGAELVHRGVAEAEQRRVDAAAQDVEHVLDARPGRRRPGPTGRPGRS